MAEESAHDEDDPEWEDLASHHHDELPLLEALDAALASN
jgi:hypothetical protein